jgi:hypothetical protein
MKLFLTVIAVLFLSSFAGAQRSLSLAGQWSFRLDSLNQGLQEKWFYKTFGQTIQLPGTLDDAGIGNRPSFSVDTLSKEVLMKLSRKHSYIGIVWYAKEIEIPHSWNGAFVELSLERVIWNTRVWVDGKEAGSGESLSTPHRFNLTEFLKPGKHLIVIRIDNSRQYDISHRSMAHAYTEGTQVIWNGIIGKMELVARDKLRIADLQLYPKWKERSVELLLTIQNDWQLSQKAGLHIQVFDRRKKLVVQKKLVVDVPAGTINRTETVAIKNILPWNEFHPNLYTVKVQLSGGPSKTKDLVAAGFGMREIKNRNSLLQVNGSRIFLRGSLECGIFPLTGHPPMERKGWLKVFATAKAYGLNHIRFHSWCPPEVAFEVADSMGFYLQVELPFWSEKLNGDSLDGRTKRFVEEEAVRISKAYGNHPSFCLWSMGNEIRGDFNWLSQLVRGLKQKDPRHLYTTTTFTFQKDHGKWPEPDDDFFVTQYTKKGWVRGQGIFNSFAPEFSSDYTSAIDSLPVPIISHEIGQYSVYPNLGEIKKYSGVLEPSNFKAIRNDLEKKGLLSLAPAFTLASGKFSAGLYKEEIERALRTKGMSGFQLLDLHDFPGQGTALVGMLDAFWDSKGLVSPEEHRMYCSAVVPLLRMSKAIYSNTEQFEATAEIVNFSNGMLQMASPRWTVLDQDGKIIFNGRLAAKNIALGNAIELGKIAFDLKSIQEAVQLTIVLELEGTPFKNKWSIWVYPGQIDRDRGNVVFTTSPAEALHNLEEGKNVLLNPDTAFIHGLEGRFAPVFWSPVHFPNQPGTMGILCNPEHAALKKFPTDFYSGWQWWDLITSSKTMVLDSLPGIEPVVRVIDNFYRNRKLANIIEAKVGKGKLILTSIDITHRLDSRPAARQLLYSLEQYMMSDSFAPAAELSGKQLKFLVKEKDAEPVSQALMKQTR